PPQRRGVHEPAGGPQGVRAAVELQGTVGAEVAREYFAVVAGALDDLRCPALVEAEGAAVPGDRPKEPADVGIIVPYPRLHIRRGQVHLLGGYEREHRPA